MRSLFLLRGVCGSGKSTWIREKGLTPYTLSLDEIRLMVSSPITTLDGNKEISQKYEREVWSMFFTLLEKKMNRGELVFVDATHYRPSMITQYKKLASKYRYRVYVVDFSDISLEQLLENNRSRESYKFVPEEVIKKMYSFLQIKDEEAGFAKKISKEECINMLNSDMLFDFNKYEKVVVFGDIHGCYEPLKEYFEKNPLRSEYFYIFVGDYIDRGLQNKEVLTFLASICECNNVLLLEGNHEGSLKKYVNDPTKVKPVDEKKMEFVKTNFPSMLEKFTMDYIASSVFKEKTFNQIQNIPAKELKKIVLKLGQMAYFTFGDKKYFITHGGVPVVKPNLTIPTVEYVKGVGKYEEIEKIYEIWKKEKDTVFIHGHRNVQDFDVKVTDNIYNLCDQIEWGGSLRIVEIDKNGTINPIKIKNTVFIERIKTRPLAEKHDSMTIEDMKKSKLINVKPIEGNIVSLNFSKTAFHDKEWNDFTCRARGLFIDNQTNNIIARGYNKFFNVNEMPETNVSVLKQTLTYPVSVYEKYNGFLALISYHEDGLIFCSKSSANSGRYVDYIKEVFYSVIPSSTRKKITEYLRENPVTMIFECINLKDNSHPIIQDRNRLVLLDIVSNEYLDYKAMPYEKVKELAELWGIEYKKLFAICNSFEDVEKILNYDEQNLEGFVLVDSKDFMFKYKTPTYKYWKWQRNILETLQKGRQVKYSFGTTKDVEVFKIMKELQNRDNFDEVVISDIKKIYETRFTKN